MCFTGYIGDEKFLTPEDFKKFFQEKVIPLREKVAKTPVGEIRETELVRAIFLYEHGKEATDYYQARSQLSGYAKEQLDKYVERSAV